MPKSRKTQQSITVLSRYFDKNVRLVAGMCSKCYLQGEDDVKIIAVNKKFLKEVEKRKKLKHITFLHDDYPCDADYISRQTSENDNQKLSPETTFTNNDYALITADTSRSRQMKPRVNYYNNNSACGNEVTNLCTRTNSLQSEEKVNDKNYYYCDNMKTETNGNFPTENIQCNLKDANISQDFKDLNPFFVKLNSVHNTSQNIQNTSTIELKNVPSYINNWNMQSSSCSQNNCTNQDHLENYNNSQDNFDGQVFLNAQNDTKFEDNVNFKSSINGCFYSKTQNYVIAQNNENNYINFNSQNDVETVINPDVLHDSDIKTNNEIKNVPTTFGVQHNQIINFSKLEKFCNSQKPKRLLKNESESGLDKGDNCNSTSLYNSEIQIKTESIKINFAKLQVKKKPDIQKPVWVPPRSPHNLIEESLFHDPWSLLIATIFLNKTSCMCARPRMEEFLKDFSGPLDVLKEHPTKLEKYFLDLGLHKKRAEQVWRMSYDYAYKSWRNPKELYGIGKYGEDAYRMFILGDLDIEPTDRFLRIYRDWARMKQKEDMNAMCPEDD